MLASTQERVEMLLYTIDALGMVKIKHLQKIHDLKSYRNACRIVSHQLKPYIHETYFNREKVIYLNKEGREMIGSSKEVKKNSQIEHTLLRNEVYFYFGCPHDWKTEIKFEVADRFNASGISFRGLDVPKKRVVADAVFSRNGYLHIIEVDNTRTMTDNKKKIELYAEILPHIRKKYDQAPVLYFFTTTTMRQMKLVEWIKAKGIRNEVHTFDDIK
jgi:Replication-relaxation